MILFDIIVKYARLERHFIAACRWPRGRISLCLAEMLVLDEMISQLTVSAVSISHYAKDERCFISLAGSEGHARGRSPRFGMRFEISSGLLRHCF